MGTTGSVVVVGWSWEGSAAAVGWSWEGSATTMEWNWEGSDAVGWFGAIADRFSSKIVITGWFGEIVGKFFSEIGWVIEGFKGDCSKVLV